MQCKRMQQCINHTNAMHDYVQYAVAMEDRDLAIDLVDISCGLQASILHPCMGLRSVCKHRSPTHTDTVRFNLVSYHCLSVIAYYGITFTIDFMALTHA